MRRLALKEKRLATQLPCRWVRKMCAAPANDTQRREIRQILRPDALVASRYSNAMKTSCDVRVHPEDITAFQLQRSFRTVGTGTPKIEDLMPGQKKSSPCMYETNLAHEQVHVKNSTAACKAFKQCVDQHSSKILGLFGDPTISYADFVTCHNDNHGGLATSCIDDERSAYEESIRVAKTLVGESRCASEKASLEANIKYWQSIKDKAPNCTR